MKNARQVVRKLRERGLEKSTLEGLPKRLPGISNGIAQMLQERGVLRMEKRDSKHGTIWREGPNYGKLMREW